METYLVGGAVRDQLLKLPINERDWVVVGSTPQAMDAAGFKAVGRDFPVFLHPKTKEEYALARTERKSGHGYHGFVFNADPAITLKEDLKRRDLTINAIAQAPDGQLIDPYGGLQDLDNRVLRHVSDAFTEDPVRVLRLARFYARFAPLGFRVADETLALVRKMAAQGELDYLVPERIWAETQRALMSDEPQLFFQLLRHGHALEQTFPELEALFGVPQPMKYHPEIDSGIHTLLVIKQTALLDAPLVSRFGALCHDLGKALSPPEKWPSHHGHERAGVPIAQALSQRLKVPKKLMQEAMLATEFHTHIHRIGIAKPQTILKLFNSLGALRRPERLEHLLYVCEADVRGRLGFENRYYPQPEIARKALKAAASITAQPFIEQGFTGPAIGQAMHNARLRAIRTARPERIII